MPDTAGHDAVSTEKILLRVQQFVDEASKRVAAALNHGRRALEQRGVNIDSIWGPPPTSSIAVTKRTKPARRSTPPSGSSHKKQRKRLNRKEMKKLKVEFLKLPIEEQNKLMDYAMGKYLAKKKVKIRGRKTSLKKLSERLSKQKEIIDRGGFKNTLEEPQVNKMLLNYIPANELRFDAPKQQLRPHEEEALALNCMCRGQCNKGFWGGHQYDFGIFARPKQVQRVLGEKWAKRAPETVLNNPKYWRDIMLNSHNLELTLMVVPSKWLPLQQYQRQYSELLGKRLRQFNPVDDDWVQLNRLRRMFNPSLLRGRYPWVSGMRVVPQTQFIFSTLENGRLAIEVVNPGPLQDQHPTFMGVLKSPKLTVSVFDLFLGKDPIDEKAKESMGETALYLANGFKFEYDPSNINQGIVGQPPRFTVREIEPNLDLFSWDSNWRDERHMVLKGVLLKQT